MTQLFTSVLWTIIFIFYSIDSCKISQKTMDCTGMKLTDCPPIISNITINELLLDRNLLEFLNTPKCMKWTFLTKLSVESNHLKGELKLENFTGLSTLNLKKNNISKIVLSLPLLNELDISYNSKISITGLEQSSSLTVFKGTHNEMDNDSFRKLIKSLFRSSYLEILNVDYNQISSLSVDFMDFVDNHLKFLGLSNNRFKMFNFADVSTKIIKPYTIDLSHNNMTRFEINGIRKVAALNFSNNLLTKINGSKLDLFHELKSFDLSNNPLNCLCNESVSFIDWVHQNKEKFVNRNETLCTFPKDVPIWSISCTIVSSTTAASTMETTSSKITTITTKPTTTATTKSSSSMSTTTMVSTKKTSTEHHISSTKLTSYSSHSSTVLSTKKSSSLSTTKSILTTTPNNSSSTTAHIISNKGKWERIALGVIVSIIIVIIVLVGLYFFQYRRRQQYQRIGENRNGCVASVSRCCCMMCPSKVRSKYLNINDDQLSI